MPITAENNGDLKKKELWGTYGVRIYTFAHEFKYWYQCENIKDSSMSESFWKSK